MCKEAEIDLLTTTSCHNFALIMIKKCDFLNYYFLSFLGAGTFLAKTKTSLIVSSGLETSNVASKRRHLFMLSIIYP